MQPDIPLQQLERALPVVEALLAKLNDLAQRLPREADSALEFSPELGSGE